MTQFINSLLQNILKFVTKSGTNPYLCDVYESNNIKYIDFLYRAIPKL